MIKSKILLCPKVFLLGFILLLLGASQSSLANEVAGAFNLEGFLYDGVGSSLPLMDGNINLRLQIMNPSKTCILYDEVQVVSTLNTGGKFSAFVGSELGNSRRVEGSDPGNTMVAVFQNTNSISGTGPSCSGTSYVPVAGDPRYLRVTVVPSKTGVPDLLSPDLLLGSVPSAFVAERAETLQGLSKSDVLQLNTLPNLTQGNVENIFSNSNYPQLQSLIAGSSSLYMRSSDSGASLPSVGVPPSSPQTGAIWYNTNNQSLQYYDGSATRTVGTSAGVTSVIAGVGLTGGVISSTGTIAVDVGTTAGKIVQVQTGGKLPVLDASLVTGITVGQISNFNSSVDGRADARISALRNAANGIAGLDVSSKIPLSLLPNSIWLANNAVLTNHLFPNPGVGYLVMTDVVTGSTLAPFSCSIGQGLKWTVSGWSCSNEVSAPVSSVAGRIGDVVLSSSDVSGLGTAAVKNQSDFLQPLNNLSDVSDAPTALANLNGASRGANSDITSLSSVNILSSANSIFISAGGTNQNVILSPSGSGHVDVSNKIVRNIASPIDDADAVNKNYVDTLNYFMPIRRYMANAGAATMANAGFTTAAISGTAANADKTTRAFVRETSASAVSSCGAAVAGPGGKIGFKMIFNARIITDAVVGTSARTIVGLQSTSSISGTSGSCTSGPAGLDLPTSTSAAYLRYSTSAGDTTWNCVTCSGSACTAIASSIGVDNSTEYDVKILTSSSEVSFYVNDILACTSTTTLPAATTALYGMAAVNALSATAKRISFSHIIIGLQK